MSISYEEPGFDPTDVDDGTMPENVATLAEHIVGHRIVKAEQRVADIPWYPGSKYTDRETVLAFTIDDGRQVYLADTDDCCAYTELKNVLEHLPTVDHIITAVNTTDGYTRWHILADAGEVLELQVGWSAGNPFYYGYGFNIAVIDAPIEAQP